MRTLLLLISLLSFFLPSAHAQEMLGQLRGSVTDDQEMAVPGTVVNLTSPQLMGGKSTETDADGAYRFTALPPGDYTVEAQKAGFRGVSVVARVVAGQSSRADLTIVPDTAGETMIVQSSAPVVDTTSVTSGVVVSKEMLRDIPTAGRDYQGAMNFAAGVVDNGTGNSNMRGGLDNGNQYFVDGVNNTDPVTNTFSMNMSLDAIEEVQVLTGGMDAQYGRALGGVVNIVTQSGGNEFSGTAQILYSNTDMQVYKALEGEDKDSQQGADQGVELTLGGPIQKDRLWFFTGLQGSRSVSSISVPEEVGRPTSEEGFEVAPYTFQSVYAFGKLTWQPTDAHSFRLHGQTDPTDIKNVELNAYTLPSGETYQKQGGWLASLGHTWTPSDDTIVETEAYASNGYIVYAPLAWRDCQNWDGQVCADDIEQGWLSDVPDGFNSGVFPYAYVTKRQRFSLNSGLTQFWTGLGDHESGFGFQAERMSASDSFPGYADGIPYYAYTTDPTDLDSYVPSTLEISDTDFETELQGTLFSLYLQDAWQPVPRLTLRPGVRLDTSALQNDVGEVVFKTANVAPRMGAAYDLTGDGRTPIHAYYGRFYDVGFLEVSGTLLGQSQAIYYYSWDEAAGDWADEPFYASSSEFLAHDDLQSPYSDEFDIGIERDVGGKWALGATFTYEKTHNLWEDDEVNLIWNDDGTEIIGYRNGVNESIFRLRTPDEVFNEYTSLELAANRQFDERWGVLSSYTWSRAYGYYQDNGEALAGASMDIANEWEDEVGLSPFDTTHSVKVAGVYRHADAWSLGEGDTAAGFLFGWNFVIYSGYPIGRLEYNEGYGYHNNLIEPLDDTYRLPTYAKLDGKTGLLLSNGPKSLALTLECFNIMNGRSVTSVDWTYRGADGQPEVDADGDIVWGTPLDRQAPRYFQIGLRGEI